MGEVVMPSGAAYKPPPVRPGSPAFEVASPTGSKIVGRYSDGSSGASFTVAGSTLKNEYAVRVFIRGGVELGQAARMLRKMADELQKIA